MALKDRKCVSCGRSFDWDANVCPYCGHDYRLITPSSVSEAQATHIGTGIRALLYIVSLLVPMAGFVIGIVYYTRPDPESKHVGKICLALSLIAIVLTVGLAALLYVMVLGFGTDGYNATPVSALTRITVSGGYRFTFAATSSAVMWGDITILFTDLYSTCSWNPMFSDMFQGVFTSEELGYETLGGISVLCTVTDLAGNGYINNGDYFTLTVASPDSFSPGSTYNVGVLYEPTDGLVCSMTFTA